MVVPHSLKVKYLGPGHPAGIVTASRLNENGADRNVFRHLGLKVMPNACVSFCHGFKVSCTRVMFKKFLASILIFAGVLRVTITEEEMAGELGKLRF
jgi:hypothetical protein